MTLFALILAELKYRYLGSLVAGTAVAVAVLSVTASLYLLHDFDTTTEGRVAELQDCSQERMDALENEARVFAKSLGFNIFIYHEEQELATFYANDTNTHYLTTDDTRKLAQAEFALLNHHLPFLRHRYPLPAFGGEVIIAGLEGEIYIKRKFQQPLEVSIDASQVQLGHAVATKLGKAPGDSLQIGGADYAVTHVRDQLGTKDDLMLFMNLQDAQRLLKLPGKVSGIMALSCNCAAGNLAPIRKGVRSVVPTAEVVELAVRARARQRARESIRAAAEEEIGDILSTRQELREQLSRFSKLIVHTVAGACSLLLFFLYGHNVKERRHEIAILRTLGVKTWAIYLVFTTKSIFLAGMGVIAGYGGALFTSRWLTEASTAPVFFDPLLLAQLFALSASVSVVASLAPTVLAARQDPGLVLNEEG
jgi:putative ABC transport system permease protein